MSLEWEGEALDRQSAKDAARQREALLAGQVGEPITIANEFAEITVRRVETRNGSRLLIDAPKSGQWVAIDPLELEALTWQTPHTFSAMIARPFAPLYEDDRGIYDSSDTKEH